MRQEGLAGDIMKWTKAIRIRNSTATTKQGRRLSSLVVVVMKWIHHLIHIRSNTAAAKAESAGCQDGGCLTICLADKNEDGWVIYGSRSNV